MTQTEALKLALEALEDSEDQLAKPYSTDVRRAITAIKEALREHAMYEVQRLGQEIQPEQDPVAICEYCEKERPVIQAEGKPWVGLTDDEIKEASLKAGMQEHYMGFHSGFIRFAQTIEAKLKEKNRG